MVALARVAVLCDDMEEARDLAIVLLVGLGDGG